MGVRPLPEIWILRRFGGARKVHGLRLVESGPGGGKAAQLWTLRACPSASCFGLPLDLRKWSASTVRCRARRSTICAHSNRQGPESIRHDGTDRFRFAYRALLLCSERARHDGIGCGEGAQRPGAVVSRALLYFFWIRSASASGAGVEIVRSCLAIAWRHSCTRR